MENLLVLDGSFAAKPMLRAAKERFRVHTIGVSPPGSLDADDTFCHFEEDYSNLKLVQSLVNDYNIVHVVPGCTDVSLKVFGSIRTQFKRPINEFLVKSRFADFCIRNRIRHPSLYSTDDNLKFPVIIKPNDSFSGKGVSVVEQTADLDLAILEAKKNSASNSFIVQKFISGDLMSVSAFRTGKNSEINYFLVKELCNAHPFSVDESYVVDVTQNLDLQVCQLLETFFEALPDFVRFLHLQFIVGLDEKIYVIEAFLRCPGDLYPWLVQLSTGFDYAAAYVNSFLPESTQIPMNQDRTLKRNIIRETLKVPCGDIVPKITNEKKKYIYVEEVIKNGFLNSSVLPLRYAVTFRDSTTV